MNSRTVNSKIHLIIVLMGYLNAEELTIDFFGVENEALGRLVATLSAGRLGRCVLPVFAAILARRKWPLDKYCKPKLCAILLDIVPFPDPGGPMIAALNNLAISPPLKKKGLELYKSLECTKIVAPDCARGVN